MHNLSTFLKTIHWNRLIITCLRVTLLLMILMVISAGFEAQFYDFKISPRIIKNIFRFLVLPGLLMLWSRTTNLKKLLEQIEALLKKKYGIMIIVIVSFSIFLWIKLSQHYTFRTTTFDLSMYDYALSNTLKGNFMYTPWLGRNYFSEHFAPILLLILPFYLIHDSSIILIVIQAAAVTLSTFPLYKFATRKLASPLAAFCIVIGYLNYYHLLNGVMFDFHMEIFMPLFIFASFFYLHENVPVKYFIFLVLGLSCKEDMPIYFGCMGIYACFVKKKWKMGILTLVISGTWALLAWKIFIPLSYPDGIKPSHFLLRWSQYGQTYTQIAWGILTHPSQIFGQLFFRHLWSLLRPLGCIPLLSPVTFVLSLPPLLLNVTSNFEVQKNLGAHYALPLVPFLFISLICGLHNICVKFPQKRHIILTVFCGYLLVMNTHLYPILLNSFVITKHDLVGHTLLRRIPDGVSISAQTTLVPHLRRSHKVYLLPNGLDSEYVIFDSKRFKWPMSDEDYETVLQKVIENKDYALSFNKEGFYLFKKRR